MHHSLYRFHARVNKGTHRKHVLSELLLFLFAALFVLASPTSAAMRFQARSLYINDIQPGASTSYTVGFRYMSQQPVRSVDLLFCLDPIPYHTCITPPGLNVSNAVLSEQTGSDGFTILSKTANRIVLTRPVGIINTIDSTYKFDGIINPSITDQAFAIRLRSHATPDATGPQIDFGSVRGQITDGIVIETQVPPMLIFCVAGEVAENCTGTNENYYSDMGELNSRQTLTAQSQMAVGTNASGGFVITANGAPMSAGTNVIEGLQTPTESRPGINQFGINLVANNSPFVGGDPEGTWANANPTTNYATPNKYKFVSGDSVAESPNVSLMKKFTISYIVNSNEELRAGVYTTTITYIASGQF